MAQRISFFLVPNLAKQVDTSIIFLTFAGLLSKYRDKRLGILSTGK